MFFSRESLAELTENFGWSDFIESSSPGKPGEAVEAGYAEYVDAVLFESAGFMQISSDICVVQGWDTRTSEATVSQIFYASPELVFEALILNRILGTTLSLQS